MCVRACVRACARVLKSLSRLQLCDPMDCSLPGSSVHRIFQARILEWVAISYSRDSSQPKDWTHISYISCLGRQIFYHCVTWEAPLVLKHCLLILIPRTWVGLLPEIMFSFDYKLQGPILSRFIVVYIILCKLHLILKHNLILFTSEKMKALGCLC